MAAVEQAGRRLLPGLLALAALLGGCATQAPCPAFPTAGLDVGRDALTITPPPLHLPALAAVRAQAMAAARSRPDDAALRAMAAAAVEAEAAALFPHARWRALDALMTEARAAGLLPPVVELALPPGSVALPPALAEARRGLRNGSVFVVLTLDNAGASRGQVRLLTRWTPNPLNGSSDAAALPVEITVLRAGFSPPLAEAAGDPATFRAAALAAVSCRAGRGDRTASMTLAMLLREGAALPPDAARARSVYAGMASQTGGTMMVYSPPVTPGGAGTVIPISTPVTPALPSAQRELALMLLRGEGGAADPDEACKLLARAGNGGDAPARALAVANGCKGSEAFEPFAPADAQPGPPGT